MKLGSTTDCQPADEQAALPEMPMPANPLPAAPELGQAATPETQPASNRRNATRKRVLKAAKLVAMDAWVFVDGTVRDQSPTGARIYCENAHLVPHQFRLLIVMDKTIQPCTVMWRRESLLGVRFTGEPKPAPPRKF